MQRLLILLAPFALLAVLACGNKQPPPSDPTPPTDPTPTEPAPADAAAPLEACAPTGCSGTVCAPESEQIMTTCEYRPEYECYKTATCERQPDGQCGWTQTVELDTCLENTRE